MGGKCVGSAWVSGRGLVACGLIGPWAVGLSLAGPGPFGAAQKPGSGAGLAADPGRDHAPKVKPISCNDSKLPGRSVGRGAEKSCTPYTCGRNQATLSPWVCTAPGPGRSLAIKLPRHFVACTPYTHISSYPATWVHVKLPFHLGPGLQNLLHSHAHVKLLSRFCNSIKLLAHFCTKSSYPSAMHRKSSCPLAMLQVGCKLVAT